MSESYNRVAELQQTIDETNRLKSEMSVRQLEAAEESRDILNNQLREAKRQVSLLEQQLTESKSVNDALRQQLTKSDEIVVNTNEQIELMKQQMKDSEIESRSNKRWAKVSFWFAVISLVISTFLAIYAIYPERIRELFSTPSEYHEQQEGQDG